MDNPTDKEVEDEKEFFDPEFVDVPKEEESLTPDDEAQVEE